VTSNGARLRQGYGEAEAAPSHPPTAG